MKAPTATAPDMVERRPNILSMILVWGCIVKVSLFVCVELVFGLMCWCGRCRRWRRGFGACGNPSIRFFSIGSRTICTVEVSSSVPLSQDLKCAHISDKAGKDY